MRRSLTPDLGSQWPQLHQARPRSAARVHVYLPGFSPGPAPRNSPHKRSSSKPLLSLRSILADSLYDVAPAKSRPSTRALPVRSKNAFGELRKGRKVYGPPQGIARARPYNHCDANALLSIRAIQSAKGPKQPVHPFLSE